MTYQRRPPLRPAVGRNMMLVLGVVWWLIVEYVVAVMELNAQ